MICLVKYSLPLPAFQHNTKKKTYSKDEGTRLKKDHTGRIISVMEQDAGRVQGIPAKEIFGE